MQYQPLRLDDPTAAGLSDLLVLPEVVYELGGLFAAAGHELHLVGGSVRDLLLGRSSATPDLDFTTDAHPSFVQKLGRRWADALWELGIAFGTVGLEKGGSRLEVTTYRAEQYERDSRNPAVVFGTSLVEDLLRRDFTVNAMAVTVSGERLFHDPFGGMRDLATGVLRTPGRPEDSFSDDPLRMLRAVRFTGSLGFTVAPEVREAMTAMASRLSIVSVERVREELFKTLLVSDPVPALELAVETGLAEVFLPEVSGMRAAVDPLHRHKDVYVHSLAVLTNTIANEHRLPDGGPDLVVRLAALLHDIGKPATRRFEAQGGVSFHHHEVVGAKMTRKRLLALKTDKHTTDDVSQLVALHLRFHGYGGATGWTDSAVRRYVRDAGDLLERLHVLTRSDCTTRNPRRAAALQRSYDSLEQRIAELAANEELAAVRPDLDGAAVMGLLGIGPSREVGRALAFLLELRLDKGPLGEEAATAELMAWAAREGLLAPDPRGA